MERVTLKDFENVANELVSIMYALTEQRLHSAPRLQSPVGKTMAEAVLTIEAAMRTFIFIARLSD